MKKLKLSLEALTVDTFRVEEATRGDGTVLGLQDELLSADCLASSFPSNRTQNATCAMSCAGAAPTACNTPYCWNRPTTEPIAVITDPVLVPGDTMNSVGA